MKRLYIKPDIALEPLSNQNILMKSEDNFLDTDIWGGLGLNGSVIYTDDNYVSTSDVWGKDNY